MTIETSQLILGASREFVIKQVDQKPIVAEYKDLWDEWYREKSKESGEKLRDCLWSSTYCIQFQKLANGATPPYPHAIFLTDYMIAIQSITQWIEDGCPAGMVTAVSEFLKNFYDWISQKND